MSTEKLIRVSPPSLLRPQFRPVIFGFAHNKIQIHYKTILRKAGLKLLFYSLLLLTLHADLWLGIQRHDGNICVLHRGGTRLLSAKTAMIHKLHYTTMSNAFCSGVEQCTTSLGLTMRWRQYCSALCGLWNMYIMRSLKKHSHSLHLSSYFYHHLYVVCQVFELK